MPSADAWSTCFRRYRCCAARNHGRLARRGPEHRPCRRGLAFRRRPNIKQRLQFVIANGGRLARRGAEHRPCGRGLAFQTKAWSTLVARRAKACCCKQRASCQTRGRTLALRARSCLSGKGLVNACRAARESSLLQAAGVLPDAEQNIGPAGAVLPSRQMLGRRLSRRRERSLLHAAGILPDPEQNIGLAGKAAGRLREAPGSSGPRRQGCGKAPGSSEQPLRPPKPTGNSTGTTHGNT